MESSLRPVIAKSPVQAETVLAGALPAGAGASSCGGCVVSPRAYVMFKVADAGIRVVRVGCVIDSSLAEGSQGSKEHPTAAS